MQYEIGLESFAIRQNDAARTDGLHIHPFDDTVELERDAFCTKLVRHERAYAIVEAAQKQRTSVEQCGSSTEATKDSRKLYGNVASSNDDDPSRELQQVKHFVRRYDVF